MKKLYHMHEQLISRIYIIFNANEIIWQQQSVTQNAHNQDP